MLNQAYVFIIFILDVFIIGLLFDVCRILRKSFKTSDFITYLQDFLFWIFTGVILLYSIFKFNNGQLRLYIFLGIVLGILLYILGFSRIFVKMSVEIILFVKKVINMIIIKPILSIYKAIKSLIYRPLRVMFINLRKMISNVKKLQLFGKKSQYKKDLI